MAALVEQAKAKLVELLADDRLAIDFVEAVGYAAASVAHDPDDAEEIAQSLWELPDDDVDVPVLVTKAAAEARALQADPSLHFDDFTDVAWCAAETVCRHSAVPVETVVRGLWELPADPDLDVPDEPAPAMTHVVYVPVIRRVHVRSRRRRNTRTRRARSPARLSDDSDPEPVAAQGAAR